VESLEVHEEARSSKICELFIYLFIYFILLTHKICELD